MSRVHGDGGGGSRWIMEWDTASKEWDDNGIRSSHRSAYIYEKTREQSYERGTSLAAVR